MQDLDKKNDPLNAEQPPKDVKKLVAAFQTVFEHQNGRMPDEGEVGEFLQAAGLEEEVDKSEGDEPDVLHTQVIESKNGDPLFYLLPNDRCFDVEQGAWLSNVPSFVAELQARPMNREDLVPMIIHGLVDPQSFAALKERKLVSNVVVRLYDQMNQQQELVKSVDSVDSDEGYDLFNDGDFDDSDLNEFGTNESNGVEFAPLVEAQVGPNQVDELFRLAQIYTLDKRLEEAIRKIVRDEIGVTSVEPLEQSLDLAAADRMHQADAAANETSNAGVVPGNYSPV